MSKRFVYLALLVTFSAGPLSGCGRSDADCRPREDDPEGYLLAVCQYLVREGIDVSPGRPDGYHIVRVEEGTYQGREVIIVYLDCCHMGDIAYIDKDSGEVLGFTLGPQ